MNAEQDLIDQLYKLQEENKKLTEQVDSLKAENGRLDQRLDEVKKSSSYSEINRVSAENSRLREERKELVEALKKCYGWSTFLDYSPEEIEDRKFVESILSKFEEPNQS